MVLQAVLCWWLGTFFPEACQQDDHWSHAHPLTGYWLSREGLLWFEPTCTKQNQHSLSKGDRGALTVEWAGLSACSLLVCIYTSTSPRLACMRVDHWLCSSNVSTSVWAWPPLMAVESQEDRLGTKLSFLPISKSHSECTLPPCSSEVSSIQQWGGMDPQMFCFLHCNIPHRRGPACCETHCRPTRPLLLTNQSCLQPHPPSPSSLRSLTTLLPGLHPQVEPAAPLCCSTSRVRLLCLCGWGSDLGITDLRRGSWEGASAIWGWTLWTPGFTSAGSYSQLAPQSQESRHWSVLAVLPGYPKLYFRLQGRKDTTG